MMVNICMITYNHENYIEAAIKGVLMQQTSFDYKLVIGEDYSTDNTRAICEQYAGQYPDKIKLLPSEKNWGMMPNFVRTLSQISSEYIALCDGDDCWTDPLKLQKQVNFLEGNKNFVLCGHQVDIYHQDKQQMEIAKVSDKDIIIELKDILTKNCFITLSVVFRHSSLGQLPSWFVNAPVGDWAIWILLLEKGIGVILKDKMGIYRVHGGGTWSSANSEKMLENDLKVYQFFIETFSKYSKQLENGKRNKIRIYRMYEYSLSAMLAGKTPIYEFYIEFKRILQLRTRLKKIIRKTKK